MSKRDKKKKKGLSKSTLEDCINLHKQKALQGFMTSWYRRYDAVEKEVVYDVLYSALTESIDIDKLNSLDIIGVYTYIQEMISSVNYEAINTIRKERLLEVYKMDKSIWTFRSEQLLKRAGKLKNTNSLNAIDFLMVKNVRSKWIDITIGKYIISLGYVFSWEMDSKVISEVITNDWNDLTDSIPMTKIIDTDVAIKPISPLGLKVRESGESYSDNKQSYVTKIIPQETSVVIIDL